MTQTSPTGQDLLLPLGKLMKIRRKDGRVHIKPEMLRRTDLTQLEHFLRFDFSQPFKAQAELHRCPCENHLEVKMTVATKVTDWPQPNEPLVDLYCSALRIAARTAFVDGRMGGVHRTSVYRELNLIVILLAFGRRTTGETILATLEHQLGRTKQELLNVLSTIAAGPKLGSSEPSDEW